MRLFPLKCRILQLKCRNRETKCGRLTIHPDNQCKPDLQFNWIPVQVSTEFLQVAFICF